MILVITPAGPSVENAYDRSETRGIGEAQNKISDAEWLRKEFEAAWNSADVTLELGDL